MAVMMAKATMVPDIVIGGSDDLVIKSVRGGPMIRFSRNATSKIFVITFYEDNKAKSLILDDSDMRRIESWLKDRTDGSNR
jgi:hypothetical protein